MKTVTVWDIAQHSGVSKSTVSLVLQASPLVKISTREKVIQSAKELGYVYNRAAASLRKTKSGTVGLVVTSIKNHFFAEAVSGVEGFFAAAENSENKTVFLGQHFEDQSRLKAVVRSMLESRVDGLIIVPTLEGGEDYELSALLEGVPTVYLSRRPQNPGVYVGTDNFLAGYDAAKHLVGHGCNNLRLVGGHSGSSAFDERFSGIRKAHEESGVRGGSLQTIELQPSRENGFRALKALSESSFENLGIIAYNDLVASGVISAANELGLKVGADFSLVGIDNIEEARFMQPPLTTVDTYPNAIGRSAAGELLAQMEDNKRANRDVILQNELRTRNSCGCKGTME